MLYAKIVTDDVKRWLYNNKNYDIKWIFKNKNLKQNRYSEFFNLFLWFGVCLHDLAFVLSNKTICSLKLNDSMSYCKSYRRPISKIHDPPVKLFSPISIANEIIQYPKMGMIDDPWILLKLLEVSLTRTGSWMMNGFYILTWSWTGYALSCKRSSSSKLSCRSKQFHRKSPDIWNKRIFLQINGLRYEFIVNSPFWLWQWQLPMTSERFGRFETLCKKRFELFVRRWKGIGTLCERNWTFNGWNETFSERNETFLQRRKKVLGAENFWSVVVCLRGCSNNSTYEWWATCLSIIDCWWWLNVQRHECLT